MYHPGVTLRTMGPSFASVVEDECIMDTGVTRIAVRDVVTLASVRLIVSV